MPAFSCRRDDGAAHRLAHFAEDVLRRKAELTVARRSLEEILRGFFVEDARIDGAVVQFGEREHRSEGDAPIAAAERTVLQQGEDEGRDLVGERWIRFAAEGRHLRPLDGVEETELRLDDTGMRLRSAELGADGAMQVDEVLNREVANASVSR